MKEKYSVTGMTCTACSAGIERTIKKLDGVNDVEVSLMGESMCVDYDENKLTQSQIFSAVESLGYGVGAYEEVGLRARAPVPEKIKKRFLFSLAFLLPLLYCSMGGMIGLPQPSWTISVALQALLSLAVIVLNFHFFTNCTFINNNTV